MLHFDGPIGITLFIIEIIGCVSFGTSGAFTAIRKKADLLGILILTFIEVFGGGILRDLIIHDGVPHVFWDPEFHILIIITLGVALLWFLVAYFPKTAGYIEKHRHDAWISLLDAVGIAAFTVVGCRTAFAHLDILPQENFEIGRVVFIAGIGVITGVGGGIVRDVLLAQLPKVFRKQFYMTPCILGALLYASLRLWGVNEYINVFSAIAVIVVLRILAFRFQWNMPTAKGYDAITAGEEKKNQ